MSKIPRFECSEITLLKNSASWLRQKLVRLNDYWDQFPEHDQRLLEEMGKTADMYMFKKGPTSHPDIEQFFIGYGNKIIDIESIQRAKTERTLYFRNYRYN